MTAPGRQAAHDRWAAAPVPRAPMSARAALLHALDWPAAAYLPPRCNSCGRFTAPTEQAALRHMHAEHPGWLARWNDTLRAHGVVSPSLRTCTAP